MKQTSLHYQIIRYCRCCPGDARFTSRISSEHQPPLSLEDNKTAIQLVTNGASAADRSKHVHIRNNFVYQFLNCGKMELRHCPDSKMVADLLNIFFSSHTISIVLEIHLKKKSAEQG